MRSPVHGGLGPLSASARLSSSGARTQSRVVERAWDVDVVVIGAGVAGLSVAIGLAGTRRVLLVEDGEGSTGWAQGGIAAAFGEDRAGEHAEDTQTAGGGRCDPDAVARLVEEGPLRLAELIAAGARFDRDPAGRLSRSREGGHRRRRVVHAGGDATGAEVSRVLNAHVDGLGVPRLRGTRVTGLTRTRTPSGPQVTGICGTGPGGPIRVRARAVVLATGGLGHVYGVTTNPVGVRGEGLALALLAGATLSNLEFVQFHPTALAVRQTGQLPLVTEALRGEGAVLLDDRGRRFLDGAHPLAELAPRDVVAAAVHRTRLERGLDEIWLDARTVPEVGRRFPTVTAACAAAGLDPARDLIPVRPAAHFAGGGVRTDAWGATDVAGLYAVGEVADTGVHGANRLASNSLLEGLVYGARVAAGLTLDLPPEIPAAASAHRGDEVALGEDPTAAARARELMDRHAGILRDAAGLDAAAAQLRPLTHRDSTCLVATAVLTAASTRDDSIGCHRRTDTTLALPASGRTEVRLGPDGVPSARVSDDAPERHLVGAAR
jgi:L-aspartate oxidase